jgi:hypothetical protein
MIERTPQFLDHLIMSDEAHYLLNGNVKKTELQILGSRKPTHVASKTTAQ